MRNEIDFLPPGHKHRVVRSHGNERKWSLWFLVTIGCAIVATDIALRYRLQGLRTSRTQAGREAEALAMRSAQIDQLSRRHGDAVGELVKWSAPLETKRATEILDIILDARPDSLFLQRVEWDSGALTQPAPAAPTLRISGVLENLGDVVSFAMALEEPGVLPKLEVRQSGISRLVPDQAMQSFVIESVHSGGRR